VLELLLDSAKMLSWRPRVVLCDVLPTIRRLCALANGSFRGEIQIFYYPPPSPEERYTILMAGPPKGPREPPPSFDRSTPMFGLH